MNRWRSRRRRRRGGRSSGPRRRRRSGRRRSGRRSRGQRAEALFCELWAASLSHAARVVSRQRAASISRHGDRTTMPSPCATGAGARRAASKRRRGAPAGVCAGVGLSGGRARLLTHVHRALHFECRASSCLWFAPPNPTTLCVWRSPPHLTLGAPAWRVWRRPRDQTCRARRGTGRAHVRSRPRRCGPAGCCASRIGPNQPAPDGRRRRRAQAAGQLRRGARGWHRDRPRVVARRYTGYRVSGAGGLWGLFRNRGRKSGSMNHDACQ